MDSLEMKGAGAGTPQGEQASTARPTQTAGTQGPAGIDTPSSIPDVEAYRKSLQADYTRKTQEVAEQRRSLENQMQQIQALQTQMQHSMSQSERNQAQTKIDRLMDRLPPEIRDNADPNGRALIETFEQFVREQTSSSQQEDDMLKHQLQQATGALANTAQQTQVQKWQSQLP